MFHIFCGWHKIFVNFDAAVFRPEYSSAKRNLLSIFRLFFNDSREWEKYWNFSPTKNLVYGKKENEKKYDWKWRLEYKVQVVRLQNYCLIFLCGCFCDTVAQGSRTSMHTLYSHRIHTRVLFWNDFFQQEPVINDYDKRFYVSPHHCISRSNCIKYMCITYVVSYCVGCVLAAQ